MEVVYRPKTGNNVDVRSYVHTYFTYLHTNRMGSYPNWIFCRQKGSNRYAAIYTNTTGYSGM